MNDDWISVRDRLPPYSEKVLVYNGYDVFEAKSQAGDWVCDIGKAAPVEGITHWQYKPQPPIPEGPFYTLEQPNGVWVLYKKHDNDCAIVGVVEDLAIHLADWLNRLWRDK